MKKERSLVPRNPIIETDQIPVEWLYELAIHEGNSKKPIYRIHKWWARRLGSIFRSLLLMALIDKSQSYTLTNKEFYSKHDFSNLIVLDPFMGGGTSIIEASKLNAKTIGVDIDPIAWFITKKEIEPFNEELICEELHRLERNVGTFIKSLYVTELDDGRVVPVIYYFWVNLIDCPKCQTTFEAHSHFQLYRHKKNSTQVVFCKYCHNVVSLPISQRTFDCQKCGENTNIHEGNITRGIYICPNCKYKDKVISLPLASKPLQNQLFAVEYEDIDCNGKKVSRYKSADSYDKELYRKAENLFNQQSSELVFPRDKIPADNRSDPRPINHGFVHYHQLFNSRQLLSLSLLKNEINKIQDPNVKEYLLIAFSDSLASNNMFCSYAFDYKKLTPLFGLHAYNVINRPVENNVWGAELGRGTFTKCVNKMIEGKKFAEKPYEYNYDKKSPQKVFTGEKIVAEVETSIENWNSGRKKALLLNQSSATLNLIENESIDIILTDPPYYDNLSYSELSDFFYVWIKDIIFDKSISVSTPYKQSLFVNGNNHDEHNRYVEDLSNIFINCNRVLKSDGIMIFSFHHRDAVAWNALAKALRNSRFKITNIFPVRSEGKSGFHSTEGTIKWDSILVCRKDNISEDFDSQPNSFNNKDITDVLDYIKSGVTKWNNLLSSSNLCFEKVDSLSLSYSILVQWTQNQKMQFDEIDSLFSEVEAYLKNI